MKSALLWIAVLALVGMPARAENRDAQIASLETCKRLLHEAMDSNQAALAANRMNDHTATCASARKTLKTMRAADRACPEEYQPQHMGSEAAAEKMVTLTCITLRQ